MYLHIAKNEVSQEFMFIGLRTPHSRAAELLLVGGDAERFRDYLTMENQEFGKGGYAGTGWVKPGDRVKLDVYVTEHTQSAYLDDLDESVYQIHGELNQMIHNMPYDERTDEDIEEFMKLRRAIVAS